MDPSMPQPAAPTVSGKIGAGVGIRFVALLIDGVILLLGSLVYISIINLITGSSFTGEISGLPAFILFLLCAAYFIVLEWKQGATVGKRVMKLTVEKVDGSPMTFGASLARNLMRIIDGLFSYLVGAIAVWASARHQRLGDMVAGTVVVKKA